MRAREVGIRFNRCRSGAWGRRYGRTPGSAREEAPGRGLVEPHAAIPPRNGWPAARGRRRGTPGRARRSRPPRSLRAIAAAAGAPAPLDDRAPSVRTHPGASVPRPRLTSRGPCLTIVVNRCQPSTWTMTARHTETITISLPSEMAREVERVRRREHRTRSELVREALRVYFDRAITLRAYAATRRELREIEKGRAEIARGEHGTLDELFRDLGGPRREARAKGRRTRA